MCAFPIADAQYHAYAPGDDWDVCKGLHGHGKAVRGPFAAWATAEPALTLDRQRGSCAGYSFASARREVRRRVAVLDRVGELDWRLQGMCHLRGLLRRLWVLKLRACGSMGVDGQIWWSCVCVPVLDVVSMVGSKRCGCKVGREYWGVRHWLF